jgi:hypothetical protein
MNTNYLADFFEYQNTDCPNCSTPTTIENVHTVGVRLSEFGVHRPSPSFQPSGQSPSLAHSLGFPFSAFGWYAASRVTASVHRSLAEPMLEPRTEVQQASNPLRSPKNARSAAAKSKHMRRSASTAETGFLHPPLSAANTTRFG